MTPEEFFHPMVEQGVVDYSSIPEGADKEYIHRFFVKTFGALPTKPMEFVKINGKFYYKTQREQRIPLQLVNGAKVIKLDNIPFVLPGTENRITQNPSHDSRFINFHDDKPASDENVS